jgi:23S rRNA pseudouridine1911/1915/1917 synthase
VSGAELGDGETFTVPPALAGERLDRAVATLTGWSRAEVAGLCAAGSVLVDGKAGRRSQRLTEGSVVELLDVPPAVGPVVPDPAVAVRVVHEDPDLIVVDKPAGVVVHPGAGITSGTLVAGLLARYPELAAVGDPTRPGIVHRLDRDTSGLLVVARSPRAHAALVRMLAAREVERVYLALVWGRPPAPRGTIDAPVGRSARRRTRMAVREEGRPARTHYEVVEAFDGATLLRCRLETGRTHQIRVHLAAIGTPVVGDAVYGRRRPGLRPARQFLHAAELALVHPFTGRPHRWCAPLPAELAEMLDRLRTGGADG